MQADATAKAFRLTDLTHIVIAAGDSDYIALAQRSKRLGRRPTNALGESTRRGS